MKHLRKILPAALLAVVVIAVICFISISSKKTVSKETEAALTDVAAEQNASKTDSITAANPVADKNIVSATAENQASAEAKKETADAKKKNKKKKKAKKYSSSVISVGIVADDGVNLRKKASTSSNILTTLDKGTSVSILAKKGDWYQVSYNGKKGYMSADYVTSKTSASGLKGYGKVTTDVLNMRSKPSTNADVVAMAVQNEYVRLRGFEDGWYKVSYYDYTGYMSGDYLSLVAKKPQPKKSASTSSTGSASGTDNASPASPSGGQSAGNGSGSGSDLVDFALSLCGVPYSYGGASPSGFDCSGFTMYVYNHFGYSLPHGATTQMDYGYAVSMSELSPGDLVFFFDPAYADSGASHVGIYIGGGQIVHASSGPGYCVKVSSFSGDSSTGNYYGDVYLTARHIAD